jgi:hypothetical protein
LRFKLKCAKLKKGMKPKNLRKARAKANEMMATFTLSKDLQAVRKKKTIKQGPLTKKATGVISLKGADYKDVLSEELTKKSRRNA